MRVYVFHLNGYYGRYIGCPEAGCTITHFKSLGIHILVSSVSQLRTPGIVYIGLLYPHNLVIEIGSVSLTPHFCVIHLLLLHKALEFV
jgi:hypothetical protein